MLRVAVDQCASTIRVINPLGHFVKVVAIFEKYLLGRWDLALCGLVDLQPQAEGALTVGQDVGFGEHAHDL